jgi:hypothetical protein
MADAEELAVIIKNFGSSKTARCLGLLNRAKGNPKYAN